MVGWNVLATLGSYRVSPDIAGSPIFIASLLSTTTPYENGSINDDSSVGNFVTQIYIKEIMKETIGPGAYTKALHIPKQGPTNFHTPITIRSALFNARSDFCRQI